MFCNHAPIRHAVPKKEPVRSKPKHPNIVAIFEELYRVKMYARDTVSLEVQRETGTLRSGDRKIDEAAAGELHPVLITINDMVEYFRDGIPIFLTQASDSKKIYEAVCAHTGEWRSALRFAYNMGNAPIEDFILMESFVASIYEHAKFEYDKRPEFNAADGTLAAFLYSKTSLPGLTYVNNVRSEARDENRPERNVKEMKYEPNVDVFQNALMQKMGIGRQ